MKRQTNRYTSTVCGVGYLGEGKYVSAIYNKERKSPHTKQYQCWINMLRRCYNEQAPQHRWYKDVVVCDEWLNFQNFAKWYDENFYIINDEIMNLDKDILIKGSKFYNPETCVFVPKHINLLVINHKESRGVLPIGIVLDKRKKSPRYEADVFMNNKSIYLGMFDTIEEAFQAYKQAKEKYIKQIADEYKEYIPDKLYQALYNWEIEITD